MTPWETRDGIDYLTVGNHTLTVRDASHPVTGASCYVAEIDGQQTGSTYAIRAMARAAVLSSLTSAKVKP